MNLKTQTTAHNTQKEVTISAGKANLYGLIFLMPLIMVLGLPYCYLWPEQFTSEKFRSYLAARELLTFLDISIGVLIMLSGAVMHELLHGLGWSYYSKKGWKSIHFGIVWKFLTPYCHCNEPLRVKAYRIGSVLPAVILGFIPSFIAILSGNLWLMVFGFFFSFAAGGDFLILWLIRNESPSDLALDHPDQIGCIIVPQTSGKA